MRYRDFFTIFGVEFNCSYKYYDGKHEENPKIEVNIIWITLGGGDVTGLLMCEQIEQALVEEIKKAHEE
jgi:hypothetical protein